MRLTEIEIDVKSGVLSNVKIGAKYGISEAYVRKLIKKHGWSKPNQDNKPEGVKFEIEPVKLYDPGDKKNDLLANMTIDLAERMCNEMHSMTPIIGQIEIWIKEATMLDATDARRNIMLKAISIHDRAATLKTLSNILVQTRGVIMSGKAVGTGKKENAIAKAGEVIKGKFAPAAAPLRGVK